MSQIATEIRPPLSPARSSSVNPRSNVINEPKKRKRSDVTETSDNSNLFSARVCGQEDVDQSFSPVTTILRAHLPLSWLNPTQPQADLPAGCLVKANISTVLRWEYHVLIARRVPNGVLYAFEKLDGDTYIFYPLHAFVTEQWVRQAAIGAAPAVQISQLNDIRQMVTLKGAINGSEDLHVPPKHSCNQPKIRKGAVARMSILSPKDTDDPNTSTNTEVHSQHGAVIVASGEPIEVFEAIVPTSASRAVEQAPASSASDRPGKTGSDDTHDQIPTEREQPDLLAPEYLRQRYLETLYLSKTSLAYYAKGPLSRARARARALNSSTSLDQLAEFYRESVLTSKKMDRKYKETLPKSIKSLAIATNDDRIDASRKKKSKRSKLGKNCLWSGEDDFIFRWWNARNLRNDIKHANAQAELHQAVSELRIRETEMQIILILEALSLEAKSESLTTNEPISICPDVKAESIEDKGMPELVMSGKKKRNLKADLDMLADKLCIWHSVGLEVAVESINTDNAHTQTATSQSKDRLRNFCADVVVPFYSSKIPDTCRTLCRSLGGSVFSPQRPTSKHLKSNSTPILSPGTVIKERSRGFHKGTLERVLSEETLRHSPPPALTRSNTVASAPAFKREPSEASQRPASRSSMHKSVSFSNREIDLVADANATAAKKRKLDMVANQKRELEAAIAALKKPNRSGAARAYMDDMEGRGGKLSLQATEQAVQISATPRAARRNPLGIEDYDLPPSLSFVMEQEKAVIPSSTVKARGLGSVKSIQRSSEKKRAVLMAIHETPSRGSAKRTNPLLSDPRSSQLAARIDMASEQCNTVAATPARLSKTCSNSDIVTTPLRMNKSLKPVIFTSMKKSDVSIERAFRDAPEIPVEAGQKMDRAMQAKGVHEASIYDTLGWDEDYDL